MQYFALFGLIWTGRLNVLTKYPNTNDRHVSNPQKLQNKLPLLFAVFFRTL